jgi:hypothetical protein
LKPGGEDADDRRRERREPGVGPNGFLKTASAASASTPTAVRGAAKGPEYCVATLIAIQV